MKTGRLIRWGRFVPGGGGIREGVRAAGPRVGRDRAGGLSATPDQTAAGAVERNDRSARERGKRDQTGSDKVDPVETGYQRLTRAERPKVNILLIMRHGFYNRQGLRRTVNDLREFSHKLR